MSNQDVITADAVETKPVKKTQADEIKELREQVNTLMGLINTLVAGTKPATGSYGETVKIIHLVERAPGLSTFVQLSNLTITMSKFGEERNVTLQQFEELVGKYRSWFASGILSVAAGYEEIAARYGVNTAKNYPLTSEFVRNLGTMRMDQVEDIYERLPESGKAFIVGHFNRKAIEGDPNFRDIRKLEVLDRLSDGGCSALLVELRDKNKK